MSNPNVNYEWKPQKRSHSIRIIFLERQGGKTGRCVVSGRRRMKSVFFFAASLFSHFSLVHFCTQHILPFVFYITHINCIYCV